MTVSADPAIPALVEWPYTIEAVALSTVFADPLYQRPVIPQFVGHIVNNFDKRLVGVIDVSAREDGTFAVMDGQQRVEAMRELGMQTCYGAVYVGLTLGEEAAYFNGKNQMRRQVSPYYNFRARLLAGDPEAIAITELLALVGFHFETKTNNEDAIGSVAAVQAVYRMPVKAEGVENALLPTLQFIGRTWRGKRACVDNAIIRGVGRFFATYSPNDYDQKRLIDVFSENHPLAIRAAAQGEAGRPSGGGVNMGYGVASTLVDLYNAKPGKALNKRSLVTRKA